MSKKIAAVICVLAVVLALGAAVFASGEASTRGAVAEITVPETAADWIMDAFSTKAFTDEPVDDALVEDIVQAGINAPSAQNKQPCRFIIVKDETLKSALAKTPVVVIVAAALAAEVASAVEASAEALAEAADEADEKKRKNLVSLSTDNQRFIK